MIENQSIFNYLNIKSKGLHQCIFQRIKNICSNWECLMYRYLFTIFKFNQNSFIAWELQNKTFEMQHKVFKRKCELKIKSKVPPSNWLRLKISKDPLKLVKNFFNHIGNKNSLTFSLVMQHKFFQNWIVNIKKFRYICRQKCPLLNFSAPRVAVYYLLKSAITFKAIRIPYMKKSSKKVQKSLFYCGGWSRLFPLYTHSSFSFFLKRP